MSQVDEQLRAAARAARTAADGGVELDRDLAATKVRAMSTRPSTAAPDGRSHRWLLAVAAVLLIAMFAAGLVVLRGSDNEQIASVTTPEVADDGKTTVLPSTVLPSTVPADPSTTTVESTTAVPTTPVAPTVGGTAAAVSYLEPPPELPLRSLGTVRLAPRGSGDWWVDVGIGDRGVVVNQSWAGYVTVVGFDSTQRDVQLDGGLFQVDDGLYLPVYGPGEVLYGTRTTPPDPGVAIPNMEVVAIPLAGEWAGQVVAAAPVDVSRYLELPAAPLGHGPDGVVDRLRDVNRTLIGYVDENGQPTVWTDTVPPLYTVPIDDFHDGGRLTITEVGGPSWLLEFEAAPDVQGTFVGPSPPAPSSDGLAVFWTHLGNADPSTDFDVPTMWVIAALHPDGRAAWWLVPDGWEVVASDVWGTVLARRHGASLELALAGFGVEAAPVADCSGALDLDLTISRYVAAMTAARATGDLTPVADCLSSVPSVFTGTVPACWTDCAGASRSFGSDFVLWGEADRDFGLTDDGSWLFFELPVSYRTVDGYGYFVETWELHPVDGGYQVSGPTIGRPQDEAQSSLAVITEYLGYVETGDWMAVSQMLYGGALSPEDRPDLQRLEPDSYTVEGLAAALQRWCRAGCDTTPPTAAELTFDGGYSLVRGGEAIRAAWFEGYYSIVGLPFRSTRAG